MNDGKLRYIILTMTFLKASYVIKYNESYIKGAWLWVKELVILESGKSLEYVHHGWKGGLKTLWRTRHNGMGKSGIIMNVLVEIAFAWCKIKAELVTWCL